MHLLRRTARRASHCWPRHAALHPGAGATRILTWAWSFENLGQINAVIQLPSGPVGCIKVVHARPLHRQCCRGCRFCVCVGSQRVRADAVHLAQTPVYPYAGKQHACFLPMPEAMTTAQQFLLPTPGRGDIIISFEHNAYASCAVYCHDFKGSYAVRLWQATRHAWGKAPLHHPGLLLGLGTLAVTLPGAGPGKPGQVLLVGMQPANWRQQLCLHHYNLYVSKALSPCTRFLAVFSGAELHILSAISGHTVALWPMSSLVHNLLVLPLPAQVQVASVKWAMDGWQLWVRMHTSADALIAGRQEAGAAPCIVALQPVRTCKETAPRQACSVAAPQVHAAHHY